MTTPSSARPEARQVRGQSAFWSFINHLPGVEFFNNLKIGYKLVVGFGTLVILILLVGGLSYWSSLSAINKINDTNNLRSPVAFASAAAQADLLGMLSDVRGYLALGDDRFRRQYVIDRENFQRDLDKLNQLRDRMDADNKGRLGKLQTQFATWVKLPEPLFELRDDRLEREAAYKTLATEGVKFGGRVLISTQKLIENQAKHSPSPQSLRSLEDMAAFQGSFAAVLSGLRNYVTTRNQNFRGEYESNLVLNDIAWEELHDGLQDLEDDDPRSTLLTEIDQNREAFLALEEQIFAELESETWRRDLYLFNTQARPLADEMRTLLRGIAGSQQDLLKEGLEDGAADLNTAQERIWVSSIVALLLAIWMTLAFRVAIAGPVVRLTEVAERIRSGNLEAQAEVKYSDETGILAATFNKMTGQLRQTLMQVRQEKRRADDLLHVVIPIGIDLSSEKDFNRLLEKILVEAKAFCHAQAGILYLLRAAEKHLEFVIVRNDVQHVALGGTTGNDVPFAPLPLYLESTAEPNSRNAAVQAALSGDSINIPNAYEMDRYDFSGPKALEFGGKNGDEQAHATSCLTIPLENNRHEVIGILQLLNAQNIESGQVIPFDANLQQMMESFSSLAVAALEAYLREEGLRQEIKKLRIEIDQVKRREQVQEIVETDFFKDLRARADSLRRRTRRSRESRSEAGAEDE